MLALLLSAALASPPDASQIATEAPAWLQNGAVLTYLVTPPNNDAFDFTITVTTMAPDLSFGWTMSTGGTGARTVLAADKAKSRAQSNRFSNGESGAVAGTSSVWLSDRSFADIAKKGSTKLIIDGTAVTFMFNEVIRYAASVEGRAEEIVGLQLESSTHGRPDGRMGILVMANRATPVILDQTVGFEVALKSAQGPSGD